MEKVDILLATYNGEEFLSEQLDSILNQTYDNFNILISDDASTDKTQEILNKYASKDKRIQIFFQKENLGIVKNFEFLLNMVKSEFFMFSDQDDIWKNNKIEKSINKIKETDSALVYSDLEVVDSNLNVIYNSYWKLKGFYKKITKYNDFKSLYLNNYITGCTILSKKEYIDKVLPLPQNSKYVLHDYWLPLIISQENRISYIDEPLIKYRQHKNNRIGSKKKSSELNSFDEIRKLFIDVKIEHFSVFIENENEFTDLKIRELNQKSLSYFKDLKRKNNINFKNWCLFFKLYKYEGFIYKMENFLILNLPFLVRFMFKFKK